MSILVLFAVGGLHFTGTVSRDFQPIFVQNSTIHTTVKWFCKICGFCYKKTMQDGILFYL